MPTNVAEGAIVYQHACSLGCEGIVSKRLGSPYRAGRAAALHRRHGMVSQVLHEHAASLSAASHANRSRRLTKCANDLDMCGRPPQCKKIFGLLGA